MRRTSKRGLALLLTVLVLPLIAALAFTLTSLGVSSQGGSRLRESSRVAVYCAEAGAEEGVQRLREDTGYSGSFARSMTQVDAQAQVTVINNAAGSTTLQAGNGARIPPGFAYSFAVCTRRDKVRRTYGILVRVTGSGASPWNYAAFGYSSINLTGNASTDSFTSAGGGTYATTRIGFGHPEVLTKGGSVGTNAVVSSSVNFSGNNARVGGRIDLGRNAVATTVVNGSPGVNYPSGSGAVTVMTANVARPPVAVPTLPIGTFSTSGVLPSGFHYGNVSLSGNQTLTFGSGTYVLDGLKLSGQATIKLATGASAEIYITGAGPGGLDLSGNGVVNLDGVASRLTFYGGPNLTSEISVTGNANAYYRVYAPSSPIKIAGNGDIFGSVVGNTVRNVGNGAIHYDRAMSTSVPPPEAVVVYRQRF